MRTSTVLLLNVILVYIVPPLCGEKEGPSPLPDNSINWISDPKTNSIFRNVFKTFKPIEEVNFYLYTKKNPIFLQELRTEDVESVAASHFNRRHPTRIIIHGWLSSSDMEVNTLIRDAYLSLGPHNIIVVNWMAKSVGLYTVAAASVPDIGNKVADFVDFMAKHDYLKPENLTLVGHSMGAHISGIAGKSLKTGQLHTIIGLDPALLLFPYSSTEKRLCPTDAYYVESIQTDGGRTGHVKPIGTATFYPNGGQTQLGCGIDTSGACAHARAYRFFAESIKTSGFPSIKCADYFKAVATKCGSKYSETVRMGAPSNAELASGVFYVPTMPRPPYAVQLARGELN